MLKSGSAHESAVKLGKTLYGYYLFCSGGYILGEYGDLIANDAGCSPAQQFLALNSKYGICSAATKSLLLSTYIKFINLFPEIKQMVMKVFKQNDSVLDVELQQRACEYMYLAGYDELLQAVCEQMPPFPERESALVKRLKKNNTSAPSGAGEDAGNGRRTARPEGKPAADMSILGSNPVSDAVAPKKQQSPTDDLLGLDDGNMYVLLTNFIKLLHSLPLI